MPKVAKPKVRIYSFDECDRILKFAVDFVSEISLEKNLKWDLLILVALSTGMRRGELLNLVWIDIDFENQTITISLKEDTIHQFYLAVATDLVACARQVQANVLRQNMVHFGANAFLGENEKKLEVINNCQPDTHKHAREDSDL